MSTVEVNNLLSIESIQKTLFSKDNISGINKMILEKFNLLEISKDNKKKVIDILIKNMKTVYKSLDLKKINQHNFESIKNQFNKLSFDATSKNIGNDDVLSMLIPNASQKKFERDFNSNPNSGNRIMDRPQSVSHRNQNQNQFLYPPDFEKNNSRKQDSRFDKLFKPIVDDVDENYKFNQYQTGRGGEDVGNRLDKLKEERNMETILPQRPKTPDFLKPINTSVRPEMERNMPFESRSMPSNKFNDRPEPQIRKRTGRPNFSEKIPEDELDTGFLSSNDNQDLYDINNIDQPIDFNEVKEDTRPFEQRLKSLQTERGNVQISKPGKNINFQDPNLDMENRNVEVEEEIPEYQPKTIEEIKKQKRQQILLQRQEMQEERQQMSRNRYQQEDEDEEEEEQQVVIVKPKKKILESNVKLTSNNERKVNMKKIKDVLKSMGAHDTAELIILKKENDSLKKKLSQVGEVDNKNKFEYVKKEIGSEFSKLYDKEKEINKKESEIKELLKKYNYLYGLKHIQMDISPSNSESNYVFEFNTINNVAGIKLMSYSIPQPRFNIEDKKNNILKISKNDEELEIKVNSGKYKIEDLLNILNKKSTFTFDLNVEQKVEIKSNEEENFDIIPTLLSKEILGFTSPCVKKNSYEADKTWDLRIEDKIYLFITNLSEEVPFAVLYLGNQAVQQFKFEDPIDLEKLELSFRDSKGRPYNFYGLNYSINLQLEINDPVEEKL